MTPEEHRALTLYLAPVVVREVEGGRIWSESSFSAALRDARGATGRGSHGEVIEPEKSASWLGALGYLAFLDQVGTAVRLHEDVLEDSNEPTVRRCLRQFAPELSSQDRYALYALRNSFAHDYSLFSQHIRNGSPVKGSHRHFAFQLDVEGEELIVPAKKPWSGKLDPSELPYECRTTVSLRQIGELGERVRSRVIGHFADGNLRIALVGGAAEMELRYKFAFHTSG